MSPEQVHKLRNYTAYGSDPVPGRDGASDFGRTDVRLHALWLGGSYFVLYRRGDRLARCFYLARKFQVESNMGKFMDPIADKILVLGAIVMLLSMGRVDPVMVFLLLARDIFIGGIRSVAAAL